VEGEEDEGEEEVRVGRWRGVEGEGESRSAGRLGSRGQAGLGGWEEV
jgi:hypothetical protein